MTFIRNFLACRRPRARWIVVFLPLLIAGCGKTSSPSASSSGKTLRLYVPCGMERPFAAAREAFETLHPDIRVDLVLDNANVLVRRILRKGESADLLVSPGTIEMDKMIKAGRIASDDVAPFGQYELVLFTSRSNPAGIATMADLLKPETKVISVPDPDENSVGRYIRQALQAQSLWKPLQEKMTFTDHPITAYKHVAREKAEASFAYRSCPLKTAPEKLAYSKIRIVQTVPKDTYGPAYACIAPLQDAAEPELAREFIAYLNSPAGRQLLRQYDVPPVSR